MEDKLSVLERGFFRSRSLLYLRLLEDFGDATPSAFELSTVSNYLPERPGPARRLFWWLRDAGAVALVEGIITVTPYDTVVADILPAAIERAELTRPAWEERKIRHQEHLRCIEAKRLRIIERDRRLEEERLAAQARREAKAVKQIAPIPSLPVPKVSEADGKKKRPRLGRRA